LFPNFNCSKFLKHGPISSPQRSVGKTTGGYLPQKLTPNFPFGGLAIRLAR
jgi:hypothetical protein